ncbi:3'-5' exonuclease [Flavobacterium aurantiibacter]|uniref:3'-5' exonuclease n=1 Tax=Flavobacterium aurantiibacter TaxID=2023067 RepID=A0A255ZVD4_9FLAO|nr:3'-5' exonuclease [Flavobacterium aurantiibacter]OYQ45362.1 3'-5' exonuclease [Flavobacterium aurantiibacter]
MIEKINVSHLLFIDIETVPLAADFSQLDTESQELFEEKTRYQRKEDETAAAFYHKAGIWAEFGKVVCISLGQFAVRRDVRNFRVTSFYGEEPKLLKEFANHLSQNYESAQYVFCGHNIKEFDLPFLCRRFLINGIKLPEKLQFFGKKPWEIAHIDTLDLWKFGDFKHYTSLKLLTAVLGIPSSKDDISGADVANVFYRENDIDRIILYCEKDVVACAQVLLRLRNEPLLDPDEILKF